MGSDVQEVISSTIALSFKHSTHSSLKAEPLFHPCPQLAIVGSDVQEVIGSAIALSLLSSGLIPLWVGALLSAAASFTLLLVERVSLNDLSLYVGWAQVSAACHFVSLTV